MSDKKITWNDIQSGNAKELMSHYKLNERQMEKKLRNHLHGATTREMQNMYKKFYKADK